MSKARRARLFERDKGICHLCGEKVMPGEPYDLDHVIPWALSFRDDDDNLRVAHVSCHRSAGAKTADDVKRIAKAARQAGEKGQRARREKRGHGLIQSRPFQKGGKTNWPKRPMSGKKNERIPTEKMD